MTNALLTMAASVLLFIPCQPALDDQCANTEYAKLHPTICDEDANGFGVGGAGSPGAGGSGDLLGGIEKILGGLTGGLL